jgi:hypothetical protein
MALVQIEKKDEWQEVKKKFKEIVPTWYGILFEHKSETAHEIIDSDGDATYPCIYDGQVCVVGEAHGWSNDYNHDYGESYCKTCDLYSGRFCDVFGNGSYLKKTVTGFVQHFEKKHGI